MASAGDDEDDYMSDTFLAICSDTKPGLSKAKPGAGKRKAAVAKRPAPPPTKSLKVQQKEKLQEGLKTTLGEDNKGFRMLQKMGFKQGMSLGKAGEGRSEPVPIHLRQGRTGLGHEVHQKNKQKQAEVSRAWRALQRQKMEAGFRQRLVGRDQEQQAERDLYKSQRACHQLDEQKDVSEPEESFFWPPAPPPVQEGDDEEEDVEEQPVEEVLLTVEEKLEILTAYLRKKHLYCIWCGTAYNDDGDLKDNCPGNTAADHED